MIDSHVHFWRYQATEFPWIDADMAVLQQDFLPADWLAASSDKVTGVVGLILLATLRHKATPDAQMTMECLND